MPKRGLVIGGVLAAVVVAYVYSGTKSDANTGASEPAPNQCQVSVTADVLNVRSAPDGKADIVDKYEQGEKANVAKKVTNGYREVSKGRWVAAEFVKPVEGSSCT